jgi:hypothetical protein
VVDANGRTALGGTDHRGGGGRRDGRQTPPRAIPLRSVT